MAIKVNNVIEAMKTVRDIAANLIETHADNYASTFDLAEDEATVKLISDYIEVVEKDDPVRDHARELYDMLKHVYEHGMNTVDYTNIRKLLNRLDGVSRCDWCGEPTSCGSVVCDACAD